MTTTRRVTLTDATDGLIAAMRYNALQCEQHAAYGTEPDSDVVAASYHDAVSVCERALAVLVGTEIAAEEAAWSWQAARSAIEGI